MVLANTARVDLDQVIWADYVRLRNQQAVAELHGLSQQAVSRAVARYVDSIPETERAVYRERQLERYEELYQAHRETALTRPRVAAIVRGILDSQCRLLGLEPKELHVSGTVEHEHEFRPPPTETTAEVWARVLERQGRPVPGELVRLDQGAGS